MTHIPIPDFLICTVGTGKVGKALQHTEILLRELLVSANELTVRISRPCGELELVQQAVSRPFVVHTTLASRATISRSCGVEESATLTDDMREGERRAMSLRHSVAKVRRMASEIRSELQRGQSCRSGAELKHARPGTYIACLRLLRFRPDTLFKLAAQLRQLSRVIRATKEVRRSPTLHPPVTYA